MITVTPNIGLTDGQVVTVTASGFTFAVPYYAGIEECTLADPTSALVLGRDRARARHLVRRDRLGMLAI